MKGEELDMLSRHDKQINDEIIPKLEDHDRRFKEHEQRMSLLEREQKEYRLEMGKVTNNVEAIRFSQDNMKDTLINTSNRQEDRLDKILGTMLNIKEKQVEAEGALEQAKVLENGKVKSAEIAAGEKITIAKLSTTQQIIVAIFGVGGFSGLVVGFQAIKWPWE